VSQIEKDRAMGMVQTANSRSKGQRQEKPYCTTPEKLEEMCLEHLSDHKRDRKKGEQAQKGHLKPLPITLYLSIMGSHRWVQYKRVVPREGRIIFAYRLYY
jgi:hypothetical protein